MGRVLQGEGGAPGLHQGNHGAVGALQLLLHVAALVARQQHGDGGTHRHHALRHLLQEWLQRLHRGQGGTLPGKGDQCHRWTALSTSRETS